MTDDIAKKLGELSILVNDILKNPTIARHYERRIRKVKWPSIRDVIQALVVIIVIILLIRPFTVKQVIIPDKIVWQDPYTEKFLNCQLVSIDPPTYGACRS